jgi:hypothetical protein
LGGRMAAAPRGHCADLGWSGPSISPMKTWSMRKAGGPGGFVPDGAGGVWVRFARQFVLRPVALGVLLGDPGSGKGEKRDRVYPLGNAAEEGFVEKT